MGQGGNRNLKRVFVLAIVFCLTTASVLLAQTADDYFQQGKTNLEDGLLAQANGNFQQAVALDPNHEGANLFYAVTRLAMISQTASFNTLLDRSGVSSTGRNVFNWSADFTRDPNGKILLPSNAPRGAELQAYVKTDISPVVDSALANLSKVSSGYQTTFRWLTTAGTGIVSSSNMLTDSTQSWINDEFGGFKVVVAGAEYTIVSNTSNTITVSPDFPSPGSYAYRIFEPIHIDYGDVLVIKGALTLAKAGIYVVTAYNLDVDIATLLPLFNASTLNIQNDLVNAYPQLLTLLPDQQLPQAKSILKDAIALLTAAMDYIVNEPGPQNRELFLIDNPNLEREFRSVLSVADITLDRPAYIVATYVDLSQFFDNPKNLRNYFPKFIKRYIQANTFPDPTFGGILPGMTAETINEGLWNWILYPESLSWTRVDPPLVSSSWGLRGVHLTSSKEGWAIGYDNSNHRGVLLHYVNGSWASVAPPSVSANWGLNAVHFTSPSEGWAVGYDSFNHRGVLLHYLNGTWTSVAPPSISGSWALRAVHFTSPNEGWTVGGTILLHYLNGAWSQVTPSVPSTSWELNGVHFISPGEGWAVGNDWSNLMGIFLHYTNGNWTSVTFPGSPYLPSFNFLSSSGLDNYLSGVDFTSFDSGWAVGGTDDNGNCLFQYGEGRWTRIKKPSRGPDNLNSVHFISADEGWAVGSGKDAFLHYSGGAWTSIKLLGLRSAFSQYFPNFTGVHFTSPDEGWVVGEDLLTGQGMLLKFSAKKTTIVDFDADGKTDIAIYRKSAGAWFIKPSAGGASYGTGFGGDPSDLPVPGDYDGDGKTDIALYRASTGAWFIYPSSTGPSGIYGVGFGGDASDIPVPADYDGDGKTDLAIYRANTGAWFIYPSSTGPSGIYGVGFGGDASDIPVPADYDGDGKTDLAIYRASTGAWFIYPSSTGPSGVYGVGFGGDPTDIPVPGDYDGDGKTDFAIYRQSIGAWFVYPSAAGPAGVYGIGFGASGDIPVPGDYDGDGKTDIAIYRPSMGAWFIYPSSTGPSGVYGVGFGGDPTDIPVTMILPSMY